MSIFLLEWSCYFSVEIRIWWRRNNPAEADLKITALNTKKNLLITTNNAVSAAYTDYSNAIIVRNETLYSEDTGLVPIALGVKKYIKSIFGTTSAEYAQVKGLFPSES